MADAHANFAYSLVATAPSPAASGTSLVVTAGQGALFPAVPFNATIWPTAANPLSTTAEIVRVTAISTDTLTITRAQESTSARTVIVGDQIAATVTAKTLTDAEAVPVGAITREGGNLTEATTTSTTAVDLLAGAGLTIAANQAGLVTNISRKTTGAAARASFGAKINTTVVAEANSAVTDGSNICGNTSATNRNEHGFAVSYIVPIVTNFTFGAMQGQNLFYVSGGGAGGPYSTFSSVSRPNAEMTDFVVRAIVGDAAVTGGADELNVYSYANA